MSLVGYASYFSKSVQFEEGGGDNQNLPEASIENTLNDIEELASTNEYYKQRGRETTNKNPNSPNVSQKSTSTKTKPRSSGQEQRRSSTGNSDDGGDKDPTKKTIEKPHIVHTSTKRKREVQKEGQELPEIEGSPKDMEVDDVIEEPSWEEQRMIETRVIAEELASQEPRDI
jgi:hypothetical protein